MSIPVRHAHSRQGSRGSRPQGSTTHGSSHGQHHQRRIATQRATFRRIGLLSRLASPVCPAPTLAIPVGGEAFRRANAAGRRFFGLVRRHCLASPSRPRFPWSQAASLPLPDHPGWWLRGCGGAPLRRQLSATFLPPRKCGPPAPAGIRRDTPGEGAEDDPFPYHIRTSPLPRVPGQPEGAPCLIRLCGVSCGVACVAGPSQNRTIFSESIARTAPGRHRIAGPEIPRMRPRSAC